MLNHYKTYKANMRPRFTVHSYSLVLLSLKQPIVQGR